MRPALDDRAARGSTLTMMITREPMMTSRVRATAGPIQIVSARIFDRRVTHDFNLPSRVAASGNAGMRNGAGRDDPMPFGDKIVGAIIRHTPLSRNARLFADKPRSTCGNSTGGNDVHRSRIDPALRSSAPMGWVCWVYTAYQFGLTTLFRPAMPDQTIGRRRLSWSRTTGATA